MNRQHKNWTLPEDNFLKKYYGKMSIYELSNKMGRSYVAISSRAGVLNLRNKSHHVWTMEETQFLSQNYQNMTYKEIEKWSVNPLNGQKYLIPEQTIDSAGIDAFIESHFEKQVVVIQGLGFVGAVMSLVCANALTEEYAVIGVDLPRKDTFWKIKSINEDIFPLIASDPKIEAFYKAAREKANFYATFDPYAYSKADVIIVDINFFI